MFKQEHALFDAQMKLAGLEKFLPEGMDACDFLTFTNGFWRFSYVYSVMERWEELGLTKKERDGLEAEMRIWLEGIPGFREVYTHFIQYARNHNPAYLDWLEELYRKPKPISKGSS